MVCYVTGSNLFGQWACNNLVLNEFRPITENPYAVLTRDNILQINWSYNILEIDDNFYVSGACNGNEEQLIKIPLPTDNITSNSEYLLHGNDYNLILVSKNSNAIWIIDLKKEKEIKKINVIIEEPICDAAKKQKRDRNIVNLALTNDCCLFLTNTGDIYSDMLPSYLDTHHCRGKICDIQCGYEHYLLLTETGAVYTWGNGRRLQLGHGDVNNLDVPTELEALAGIKIIKICTGGWHSLAVSEFGDLYVWGWNDTGQLGIKHDSSHESYPVPTLVNLFDENGEEVTLNVKDIACGSRHSAILLEDNSVWTSGFNKYGQLGFSEVKYPAISYFKKAFHCEKECTLMCGPWTTVIFSS